MDSMKGTIKSLLEGENKLGRREAYVEIVEEIVRRQRATQNVEVVKALGDLAAWISQRP